MLESNQDRHEVIFKFPPQLPQTNLQNILAKHHHKHKLTEIDKFHLHTKPDTTKTTPMAWARLKNGQISNTKDSSKMDTSRQKTKRKEDQKQLGEKPLKTN